MSTREEQVRRAEQIARDNPEWTWMPQYLYLRRHSPVVVVMYWPHVDRWSGAGPSRDVEEPTPAAAIRALGYALESP